MFLVPAHFLFCCRLLFLLFTNFDTKNLYIALVVIQKMYIQLSNSFGHWSAERILPYENCSYSTEHMTQAQVRCLAWNMRHFVRKVCNWATEVQVRILRQPFLFLRRFSHAVITCTVHICSSCESNCGLGLIIYQ